MQGFGLLLPPPGRRRRCYLYLSLRTVTILPPRCCRTYYRYFSLLLEPPSQAPVQVQTKGLRERAEEQRAIDRERELLEAERVQHRAEEDALRLKQARERAAEEEMRAAEREVVALLGFRCFGVSVFRSSVVRDWGLGFFFFRGFVDSPSS